MAAHRQLAVPLLLFAAMASGCFGVDFAGVTVFNNTDRAAAVHVDVAPAAGGAAHLDRTLQLAPHTYERVALDLPDGSYLVHAAAGELAAEQVLEVDSSTAGFSVALEPSRFQIHRVVT